jgi:uncharacterized protein YlxW (UPF0749 family)
MLEQLLDFMMEKRGIPIDKREEYKTAILHDLLDELRKEQERRKNLPVEVITDTQEQIDARQSVLAIRNELCRRANLEKDGVDGKED